MHHSYDVAGPARKNLLVFLTFTLQRKNAMSASLCFYNVHYQENLRNSCLRNYSRCSETFMFAQAGCTAIAFWTFVFPLGFFFLVNKLVHTNWCALIPVAKGGTVCARACVCVCIHEWIYVCVGGWVYRTMQMSLILQLQDILPYTSVQPALIFLDTSHSNKQGGYLTNNKVNTTFFSSSH